MIVVHHLLTFKNGGALDIIAVNYWWSLCLYIIGLDTSDIELKVSLHYVQNTSERAIKLIIGDFLMFFFSFSTNTVDCVWLIMKWKLGILF